MLGSAIHTLSFRHHINTLDCLLYKPSTTTHPPNPDLIDLVPYYHHHNHPIHCLWLLIPPFALLTTSPDNFVEQIRFVHFASSFGFSLPAAVLNHIIGVRPILLIPSFSSEPHQPTNPRLKRGLFNFPTPSSSRITHVVLLPSQCQPCAQRTSHGMSHMSTKWSPHQQ